MTRAIDRSIAALSFDAIVLWFFFPSFSLFFIFFFNYVSSGAQIVHDSKMFIVLDSRGFRELSTSEAREQRARGVIVYLADFIGVEFMCATPRYAS